MANLTFGTSDYPTSIDTRTLLSDGAAGDEVLSAHINGLLSAMVNVQTELGTGLKGVRSNLAARLNTSLDTNGAINKGTAFPSSPTPVLGQPFYRTDLDQLYVFDSTSQWKRIDGISDHGLLGGLADDDHSQYLNTARHDVTARHGKAVLHSTIAYEDEANTFVGNQAITGNLSITGSMTGGTVPHGRMIDSRYAAGSATTTTDLDMGTVVTDDLIFVNSVISLVASAITQLTVTLSKQSGTASVSLEPEIADAVDLASGEIGRRNTSACVRVTAGGTLTLRITIAGTGTVNFNRFRATRFIAA